MTGNRVRTAEERRILIPGGSVLPTAPGVVAVRRGGLSAGSISGAVSALLAKAMAKAGLSPRAGMRLSVRNASRGQTWPVAAAGAAPFNLEAFLQTANLYQDPAVANVELSGSVLLKAHFTGTVSGFWWTTGAGPVTWDADAFGTGKPGIVMAGTDSGHNYLYARPDVSNFLYGADFMLPDDFWVVLAVYVDSISTNSAHHHGNDRLIGGATSTFGVVARSTPIVQAGGDTSLGQITVAGPAVPVGAPAVVSVRKDATKLYVSVNGGAEESADVGDLDGLMTDILVMGNSDAGNVGFAGKTGKVAIFSPQPAPALVASGITALRSEYGTA